MNDSTLTKRTRDAGNGSNNRTNMLLLNLMSSIDYLEQEMGLVKNTIQSFESDLVEFKEKLSKMEEVTQNIRLVVAKLEGAALATHIKIDTNIDTIEGNASIEQKIK